MDKIEKLVTDWHLETFPNATNKAILDKAYEEIREFQAESIHGYDGMFNEAADIAIVLIALCSRNGKSLSDLISHKMEINKLRVFENEDSEGGKWRSKR